MRSTLTKGTSWRTARLLVGLAGFAICAAVGAGMAAAGECDHLAYTDTFRPQDCTFLTAGRAPYFVLEPGYWLRLEGGDKGERTEVIITVTRDTQMVDGVKTRVVEERERLNGEIIEISRNFMALCAETGSVFYFGEDVDIYEDGVIVSHDGAWRAGVGGARAGILMPGAFLLGSRYFQEVAPGVALDRACHTAMNLTETTPAGTFRDCVEVRETTPLEPGSKSIKGYCPGIGLIRDSSLKLVDWSERR